MKTEQEIVLQKKILIIFSLVILVTTMGILNVQKKNAMNMMASNEETNEKIIKVLTNYSSSEELLKIDVSGELNSGEVENASIVESGDVSEQVVNENEVNKSEEEKIIQDIKVDEEKKITQDTKVSAEVASRGSFVRETNTPPTEYEKVIQVKATAYCLCKKCCGKTPDNPRYGYTASGLRIIPGTNMKVIAVDTSLVSLGTEVYVEGLNGASNYGYAIAADTGSAIKNNKIDLYMDTHEQALAWGVKNVNLYILSK